MTQTMVNQGIAVARTVSSISDSSDLIDDNQSIRSILFKRVDKFYLLACIVWTVLYVNAMWAFSLLLVVGIGVGASHFECRNMNFNDYFTGLTYSLMILTVGRGYRAFYPKWDAELYDPIKPIDDPFTLEEHRREFQKYGASVAMDLDQHKKYQRFYRALSSIHTKLRPVTYLVYTIIGALLSEGMLALNKNSQHSDVFNWDWYVWLEAVVFFLAILAMVIYQLWISRLDGSLPVSLFGLVYGIGVFSVLSVFSNGGWRLSEGVLCLSLSLLFRSDTAFSLVCQALFCGMFFHNAATWGSSPLWVCGP